MEVLAPAVPSVFVGCRARHCGALRTECNLGRVSRSMCSRLTPRRTVSNSSCLATPDKSGQSPMTTKTAVSRAHRTALACRTIHGESQHAHPDVSECRTVESIPGHRHAASNHRQRVIPGLRRPAEPAGRERGQRSHVHELLALWVGAAHTLSADVGVSQLDFCRLRSPCHLRRGCRTGVSCVAFECAAKPERVPDRRSMYDNHLPRRPGD